MLDLRVLNSYELIVFEVALFRLSIRKHHFPYPVLNTILPLPFINRAVYPVHFSVAVSLIVFIVSFEVVSTRPLKDSKTIFLVKLVLPFVAVSNMFALIDVFLPLSLPVFQAILKVSCIDGAIAPLVLPLPVRLSKLVFTCIIVSIGK